jgi:hypothetical protein
MTGGLRYFPLAQVTNGDFHDAINRFYETPENRPIPIIRAMEIVTLKFNGKPDSCISEQANQARQVAAGLKTQRQAEADAASACYPKATKSDKPPELKR